VPANRSLSNFATALDEPNESSRQFMNAIILAPLQRVPGQQFSANSNRRSAGADITRSGHLIHASGCNQFDMRQRQFE
jgi:hypothetical protein